MHKTEIDTRLDSTWWALRLLFGVVPVVAGLDKYFNLLTDWTAYLNPLATKLLPISAPTFMHIVGVVEIAAGLIVLSRWTRLGSYVVTLWLVAIALNLLPRVSEEQMSPSCQEARFGRHCAGFAVT